MSRDAASLLRDAVGLWMLQPTEAMALVDAATDALVAGIDSPTLRELAGASAKDSQFVLQKHVDAVLNELGLAKFAD